MSRDELRLEWKRVDELRRKAPKGSSERALLAKECNKIEHRIANMGMFIDSALSKAESHIFASNVSIFDQNSAYFGPTSHGSSLGDGNYWNRGGHH